MRTSDQVLSHFESHFGKWTCRSENSRTVPGEPSVWIYEWPRPDFGMTSFTTVGYADQPLPQTDASHRIEFVFSAKDATFEDASEILLTGCATPLDDGQPLRLGHTIGPLREPIGAGMTRLFFTTPWEGESFLRVDVGTHHAEILMVVPLYESEFELLRDRGEEEMWQAIERQALDITYLHRKAVASRF